MRLVAIDFETTGKVRSFDNVPWQLGAVCVEDNKVLPETCWETYFHVPVDRPFSPRAPGRWAQIRAQLATAPTFAEQWPELQSRLVMVPLIAHNAATERTILTAQAPLSPFGPWRDTLALTRKYWPILPSYKLSDLIRTFGLEKEVNDICPNRTWHDALYDAVAGAVLWVYIERLTNSSL